MSQKRLQIKLVLLMISRVFFAIRVRMRALVSSDRTRRRKLPPLTDLGISAPCREILGSSSLYPMSTSRPFGARGRDEGPVRALNCKGFMKAPAANVLKATRG
jgi:hypothetical protein